MRIRCSNRSCRKGVIETSATCQECKGTGYLNITLGVNPEKKDMCKHCKGKGVHVSQTKCEECKHGFIHICDFCGTTLDASEEGEGVCSTCDENPIVIKLAQPLDHKYLDGTRALAGSIKSVTSNGIFVDLGLGFVGFFKSDYNYSVGNEVAIRLRNPINTQDRGNNKTVSVIPLRTQRFKVVKKSLNVDETDFATLRADQRGVGKVLCVVTGSFQIQRGPLIIDLVDGNGEAMKVSTHADEVGRLGNSTVVWATVRFKVVNEQERSQLYNIDRVKATEAIEFLTSLASYNQVTKTSIDETPFNIESTVYESMKETFLEAAKKIRAALLRHQNIIIRYHSPCVDGTSGAYAIDHAIKEYLNSRGARRDDHKRLVRRLPQRNPFFEIREAVRDLSFVLDSGANVFNLPLYILVDVGSSEESKAALDLCKSYGVDVIIVDHHLISDGIDQEALTMLNPNITENNSNVNSGMVATELAKFIVPEVDISYQTIQLAAVSGKYDRIEGPEITKYLELAEANEFDSNRISNIISAVDYITFGLRNFDGAEVVRNVLGISGDSERNTTLIENVTPTAQSLFAKSSKIMKSGGETEKLGNGTQYTSVDFDLYAPRYEYPTHSDLLAGLHYSLANDSKGVAVTVGYGMDYAIVRSSELSFFFPEFLEKLQNALPDFSISGSGHRTVGSIQFYAGHIDEVLEEIKKLLGQ